DALRAIELRAEDHVGLDGIHHATDASARWVRTRRTGAGIDRLDVAATRDRRLDRLGIDRDGRSAAADAALEFRTRQLRAPGVVHHHRRLPAGTVIEPHADRAALRLGIGEAANALVADAHLTRAAEVDLPAGTIAEHGTDRANRIRVHNDHGRIAALGLAFRTR